MDTGHTHGEDHAGMHGGHELAPVPGRQMEEAHPPPTSGHPERHATVHEHHDIEDFRRRFWVTMVLTLPVLFYADLIQSIFHYTAPAFPGSSLMPFILSSAIFFYGGSVFLVGAYHELAVRLPGMMTLVSLAITVAYVYSALTEFLLGGMALYWELDTLVVIMLLGHWMEMRAVGAARGALAELARLLPDTAELVSDDHVEAVSIDRLKADDVVLVRPGARIPADGEVVQGESSVNEAIITGESRLISKSPGDQVIAGAVNGEGSLRVRVTRVGEQTALAGIMRLVEQAQQSRSRAQVLADRAAFYLTIVAIGAGTLTAVAWLALTGSGAFALERTVTVLVIACPHALGLAIPLVISISTTLAARSGLLVRDRLALEKAREVDAVVFDKTGTLTVGEQRVVGLATVDALSEDGTLALAAAVEADSEHPLARAIVSEAARRGVPRPAASEFTALPGRGAQARVDGRLAQVGGPRLLESLGLKPEGDLEAAAERWGGEGKTVVYLVLDGHPQAAIALGDAIRPESYQAVARLRDMGVRVAMLTGDSEDVARWVASELGIDEYFAQVLPEHKSDRVRELQKRGQVVAMVGDGVNDAPALVTADVGIAIGAGTDVAIESAGIILVKSDPRDIPRIIELSRASYGKMIQNLVWATGYNVVAIPLAAGILAPIGIVLIPAVGALFMSASTVIVALNAQLLRRLNLQEV
ncbi:MAG: heavy metal translocating P-type ATPase [Chloroflexi bacterium]|nr:heavy metal translocating P-type ATPase [Chloroflexota bacterium]